MQIMNLCCGEIIMANQLEPLTILNGIKSKLPANNIVYDKACDLVENKVTQSYFSKTSIDGKKGFKATYWNNRDMKGDIVATDQITNPLKITTAGDHEFATGVKLVGFSAKYETEFIASRNRRDCIQMRRYRSF